MTAAQTAARRGSVVVADVLLAVSRLPGGLFLRRNVGTARTAEGRLVRFGRPGQADIEGCYRGHHVEIECKAGQGRQSREQANWQAAIERAGGVYILARSADDALSVLATLP